MTDRKRRAALFMAGILAVTSAWPVMAADSGFQEDTGFSGEMVPGLEAAGLEEGETSLTDILQEEPGTYQVPKLAGGSREYVEGQALVWMERDASDKRLYSSGIPFETEILAQTELKSKDTGTSPAGNAGTYSAGMSTAETKKIGTALLVKAPGTNTEALMKQLADLPDVKGVQPNYIVHVAAEELSPELVDIPGEEESEEEGITEIGEAADAGEDQELTGEAQDVREMQNSAGEEPQLWEETENAEGNKGEESLFKEDSISSQESGAELFADDTAGTEPEQLMNLDMQQGVWSAGNQGQYGGTVGVDMNLPSVWSNYGTGSEDVVVAVVDSGIDLEHPDLESRMWRDGLNYPELVALGGGECGINMIEKNSRGEAYDSTYPDDDLDHGTHCAGIIGAAWNGEGINGITDHTKLMAVKVLSDAGSGTTADCVRALAYVLKAVQAGVNVKALNYSLGVGENQFVERELEALLGEAGVVVCIASGNDTLNLDVNNMNDSSQITAPGVLVVDAMDGTGTSAVFSNYGMFTQVYAPGVSVLSTYPSEMSSYLAAYADGNLVYTGFEEPGNTGTDKENMGQGISFHYVDKNAANLCGTSVETIQEYAMLGQKALCIKPGTEEIISEPLHILNAPEEQTYFSAGGYFDNYVDFLDVYFVSADGTQVKLESLDGLNYFWNNTWQSVGFAVPMEFRSWDNFQIMIKFVPYARQGADSADGTCYMDCVGIGVQQTPYTYMCGTSMAAPAVTGLAALLSSIYPDETADTIAAAIQGGVRRTDKLQGLCLSGGYVDAAKSVTSPEPVIQAVSQDGEAFALEGHFFGNQGRVLVNGSEVEVYDYSESYIRAEIPEGMVQTQAEIRVESENGWGRYYAILGEREDLFDALALPTGDELEDFQLLSAYSMAAVGGKLFYNAYAEIPDMFSLLVYDTQKGEWSSFLQDPAQIPELASGSMALCGWNSYLYLTGITTKGQIVQKYDPQTYDCLGTYVLPSSLGTGGQLLNYNNKLLYLTATGDIKESSEFYEISVENRAVKKASIPSPQMGIGDCRVQVSGDKILISNLLQVINNSLFRETRFFYYDGKAWQYIQPPVSPAEQNAYGAAGSVKDGFLICGPVKDMDAQGTEWVDTWYLTEKDGKPVFEEQERIFCPSKCTDFAGTAYKGKFYVTAFSAYTETRLFRCMDGVETLDVEDQAVELNGWQNEDGKTFYYKDGKPVTGWQKLDGRSYYFWPGGTDSVCSADTKGQMVTGWLTLKKSGRSFYLWNGSKTVTCNAKKKGQMCTGWVTFQDGSKYYFNNGSQKVKNNARQLGQMCTGWVTSPSGKKFYFWTGDSSVKCNAKNKGQMVTSWLTLKNGNRYFFWAGNKRQKCNATMKGHMVTGTLDNTQQKCKYYFDKNGKFLKKASY